MEYKEFSAKTVEDAVIKASIELETASDHVEYEVIEKGSTGILGLFGSKPAVIRARVKEEAAAETEGITPVKEFEKESVKETAKVEKAAAEKVEKTAKTEKAAENFDKGVYQKEKTAESEMESVSGEEQKNQETVSAGSDFDSDEYEKFLNDIFRIMDMEVKIESKFDEKNNMLDINLVGDDMGILIGKRGQTLDSLQYLVSLLVNKKRESYVRVKLDTENYRERRKETLETLAKNIASKVKRTKRPVSLEPMNPYERRVIHAVLQNDKYVLTRSEGEEPYRHVVVFLKRERYHKS
ncbi:MAG: protein jag [Lachnospiraceae bacterium]|nr:protein jag [Lachnospiraceae bacterium]